MGPANNKTWKKKKKRKDNKNIVCCINLDRSWFQYCVQEDMLLSSFSYQRFQLSMNISGMVSCFVAFINFFYRRSVFIGIFLPERGMAFYRHFFGEIRNFSHSPFPAPIRSLRRSHVCFYWLYLKTDFWAHKIEIILNQCWFNVMTLNQHWSNAVSMLSASLGISMRCKWPLCKWVKTNSNIKWEWEQVENQTTFPYAQQPTNFRMFATCLNVWSIQKYLSVKCT